MVARQQLNSLYPMERIAEPSEVAAAVLFLASNDASFVDGASLTVDSGLMAGVYPAGWSVRHRHRSHRSGHQTAQRATPAATGMKASSRPTC